VAWQGRYERAELVMRDFFYYVIDRTVPEEKVSWLRAIHDDPDLKRRALEEEYVFRIYAATVDLPFRFIHKPKPDWDEALEELRHIARMPMSVSIKE
jgi:hypothetical protein